MADDDGDDGGMRYGGGGGGGAAAAATPAAAGGAGRPSRTGTAVTLARMAASSRGVSQAPLGDAALIAAQKREADEKQRRRLAREATKQKMLAAVVTVGRDNITEAYADAVRSNPDLVASNADTIYREQISKAAARLLTLENTKRFDEVKEEVMALIARKQLGEAAYENILRAVFASSPTHFNMLQDFIIEQNKAKGIATAPVVSVGELEDLFGAMRVREDEEAAASGGAGGGFGRGGYRKAHRSAHRKSRKGSRKARRKSRRTSRAHRK